MNKTMTVSAGILAAALMFSAAPAMARVDVGVHIGIPGPVYYTPRPVYVQPHPVYVHPRPVYYVDRHHHKQKHYKHYHRRDNDRDGVPNRYDRRPNNPHRY